MREIIKTRRKVQEIYSVETFEDLLEKCMLTDTEKAILRLHYQQGKDLAFIGDELGFSESTIKRKHRQILIKISHMV